MSLTFNTSPHSSLHLDTMAAPHHLKPYHTHPITCKVSFPPMYNLPVQPNARTPSSPETNPRREAFKTELFRVRSRDADLDAKRHADETKAMENVEFVLQGRLWVALSDLHFLLTPSAHPYTTALHSPPGSPRLGGGRRLSFNALFGGKPAKPMSPPSAQDSFELEDDSDQESGSTPGVRKLRVKRTSQGAVGGTRMERTKSVGDGWPLVIDNQPLTHFSLPVSLLIHPSTTLNLQLSKPLPAGASTSPSQSFLERSPATVTLICPPGTVDKRSLGGKIEFVFGEVLSGDSEAEVLYDHIHLAMERARGKSGLTSTGQL